MKKLRRNTSCNSCYFADFEYLFIADIPDEHGRKEVVPDWLFPFAEAKITTYSSFAVIWRLKSFTFPGSSSTTTDFTCTVPDYPGVSVSTPWSAVPESANFSLTLKVRIFQCKLFMYQSGSYYPL